VAIVAVVSVAALEIALTAGLVALDVLPLGFSSRLAAKWIDALKWWPVATSVTFVAAYWRAGVYSRVRGYTFLAKISRIAQAAGLLLLGWLVLLQFVGGRLDLPVIGTTLSFFAIFVATVATRLSIHVLHHAGLVDLARRDNEPAGPVRSVLVIGGAGYIGASLCRLLLDEGYHVRVLDTFIYGEGSLELLAPNPRLEVRRGDVRDLSALVAAMRNVDAVVHLAAIVGDPACELDHQLTMEINLLATRSVRDVALALGVQRLVFASSCSVYGSAVEVADERSETIPVSLYGRTKLLSEQLVLSRESGRLCTTVLRFATLYGMAPRPRFDLVVNLFVAQALTEKVLRIHGGQQWRPLLHVRDAAASLAAVLRAPADQVDRQVFNIGADADNYRIAEIAESVVAEIPGTNIVYESEVDDRRTYRVSFRKAAEQLGFSPRVTLTDGIRELREALKDGRVRDYKAAKYSNVQHLSQMHGILMRRDSALIELAESS
jgi:nucleoside-diphosphate-sugar epimerase